MYQKNISKSHKNIINVYKIKKEGDYRVIKISRTSDNTNKKLYISICKAEERVKNRDLFEKEFFEIVNNKFETDKDMPNELLLVYEPYDDKLDVISIYEDHLYMREGIFITKFDKEELLLQNIFNITLSEENLNSIFIYLKMKCINDHKNTIKEVYYLGDICIFWNIYIKQKFLKI